MGFWSRLFSSRRSRLDVPPELERIFKKLHRLASDGEPPISHLPPDAQIAIQSGQDVDELPDAVGSFGHAVTNPIPVRGPVGQVNYLSRLITGSGQSILGHRIGHIDRIDVYEVVSIDGIEWDILYLSMYHPRNSRKTPSRYSLAPTSKLGPFFTCVAFRVDEFPSTMDVEIKRFMRATVGFPLCPPKLGEYLGARNFTRPAQQLERLREVARLGMEPSSN